MQKNNTPSTLQLTETCRTSTMAEELKLYGMWASPFGQRIELALKLKGVPYECIEEDLSNKSPSLVKYNPVHMKVPVLDSYQRAMARFWARFIDEKILPTVWKANFCEGEETELVIEEVRKHIKILEKELNGKDFFGGSSIGFVDIAGIVVAFWFQLTQDVWS
ncbi:hypothetical protein Ddye_023765 [Dipteronia dyeriana]|uniref:glutathione transferase n=1 Tax=Dipteronia dyeriana TaxID=168575 RepID=A0AAD9WTM6_9ROSI|nr:hypothetical protein Ddye_023765 [Dipteronia dyeriana]